MSHLQVFSRCSLRKFSNVCSPLTNVTSRNISQLSSSISKSWLVESQRVLSPSTFTLHKSLNNNISRTFATKNDQDIAEFLGDEIAAEKSNLKKLELPGSGFEVKGEGSEVTFTKNMGNEKIVITMNVNHTVDSAEPDDGTEEAPEMKSKPNFEVDIVKPNEKTLSFSCSFVPPSDPHDMQGKDHSEEEAFDDIFAIDEVTMFEGENWDEKKYAVAGDILDGYLYDLFMNMLNERGITKEFVDKMSEYCSAYEHSQYISFLENLQTFVK